MTEFCDIGRRLFVVSAPSGAGKSTLTQGVAAKHPDIKLSVSTTTRPIRGDEREGREYYFVGVEQFFRMRQEGEFLESAQVHGHYYGTRRRHVEDLLQAGFRVIFDIDVQGAAALKAVYPTATLIFIAPPSRAELERRLRERKTDDPAEIAKRLRNATGEIFEAEHFDYVVVNDELPRALAELEAVLAGGYRPQEAAHEILARLKRDFADEPTLP